MFKIHALFIPHSSNNFRAHLLKPPAILFYLFFLLFLQIGFDFTSSSKPGILGVKSDITVEQIIDLTNKARTKAGLSSLIANDRLSQAAYLKGTDMMAKNYWAHKSPDGKDPWYYISQINYKYSFAGENLARNFSDSQSVVNAWLNSPSHRDNLLDPRFQEIGVAVFEGFYGGYDTTLIVQMFGTPSPLSEKPAEVLIAKTENVAQPQNPIKTAIANQMPQLSPIDQIKNNSKYLISGISLPSFQPVSSKNLINPFNITWNISLLFLVFTLVLLLLDAVFIAKLKIRRIAGHNFAHGTFLLMILLLTFFLIKGGQIV